MEEKSTAREVHPPDLSSVNAFILCGGLGTRLRSVLADRPKSMATIGERPFLELLLEDLRSQGFKEVILGTGYLAEQIAKYFEDGSRFGMRIIYSQEHSTLGTGGAVKLAEDKLSDPVLVMNGDSYVEWDWKKLANSFVSNSADLVMLLQPVPDVSRYGSVTVDSNERIIGFVEKGQNQGPGLINAGIYLLRKKIVTELSDTQAVSLEKDVFPKLLSSKVYGVRGSGFFIDIGIPEDLERAKTLLAKRVRR